MCSLLTPSCPGARRVLAAITDPDVLDAILTRLDLPTAPLPVATACAPPQLAMWPDAVDPCPDLDVFYPA